MFFYHRFLILPDNGKAFEETVGFLLLGGQKYVTERCKTMMNETPEKVLKEIFSQRSRFGRWLAIEAALAKAQAKVGDIPQEIAEEIVQKAKLELLDFENYDEMYAKTGHPMVAFLRTIQPQMGDAGQYLHIGPTTHDIIDTGTILALQETYNIVFQSLRRIEEDLLGLADRYKDTLMAARTHNVQAVPITFGFKAAIMAAEVRRCIERLLEGKDRVLTLQLSGAGGTMAAFGRNAREIQRLVAADLGLNTPEIAWHAARDRLVEFMNLLTLIGLALGRIAQEVYLLMATEVGEIYEPWETGIVGSSCMPHKINPTISQNIISLARKIRYDAFLIAEVGMVDHEWNLEHFLSGREKVEEACINTGEMLSFSENLIGNMSVNTENMARNLNVLKGLMQSENVMLALGEKIGKMHAHEIINEDATKALRSELSFTETLMEDERVNPYLTSAEIDSMLDPKGHTGLSTEFASEIVANGYEKRKNDPDRIEIQTQ